ncbi:uncharacterized protein LOC127002113 [Eriocheir sinensis]|uniref:uncharacterized protein LOC127002113 n=1 Tax=Eriocheir sinensis TaxID=95602 RepID=UPI0021CABFA1|nr:uncharacterized protein LOC127002113 [Eriocheir sinensis]
MDHRQNSSLPYNMKVLVYPSLVMAVLLVLAAGDKQEDHISALFWGHTSRKILETCASQADLCSANADKCYECFIATKLIVATKEDAALAKEKIIECGNFLSVGVDFSSLSLKCFQKLKVHDFGVDLWALLFNYKVPESQIGPMYECVLAKRINKLKNCLTSTNSNN